jgi:hypothetical protein
MRIPTGALLLATLAASASGCAYTELSGSSSETPLATDDHPACSTDTKVRLARFLTREQFKYAESIAPDGTRTRSVSYGLTGDAEMAALVKDAVVEALRAANPTRFPLEARDEPGARPARPAGDACLPGFRFAGPPTAGGLY